jgi:hypothetical protein
MVEYEPMDCPCCGRVAEAYLNASDMTTYLNAQQSALAAGYSQTYSRGRSYQLLENVGVREAIDRIELEKRKLPDRDRRRGARGPNHPAVRPSQQAL